MSTSLREPVRRSAQRRPGAGGTFARVAGAVVLSVHGAVHLMGLSLLWRLGEPGTLRYGDAHPAPGSAGGLLVGGGWLVSAVLFVTAAVVLVARRRWRAVTAAAAVLSLAVLAPSASVAVAGLVVDVAVLLVVLGTRVFRRRSSGDGA